MTEFVAFEPGIEVYGQSALSLIENLGPHKTMVGTILNAHGIGDPRAGPWFPLQAYLDALREIGEEGGRSVLWSIGSLAPKLGEWPASVRTIEDALGSIDMALHLNHRKDGKIMFDVNSGSMEEGMGHTSFQMTGVNQGTMSSNSPYPCEFDRGMIESAAEKFKPDSRSKVTVVHDASSCRTNGDEMCIYHISW